MLDMYALTGNLLVLGALLSSILSGVYYIRLSKVLVVERAHTIAYPSAEPRLLALLTIAVVTVFNCFGLFLG